MLSMIINGRFESNSIIESEYINHRFVLYIFLRYARVIRLYLQGMDARYHAGLESQKFGVIVFICEWAYGDVSLDFRAKGDLAQSPHGPIGSGMYHVLLTGQHAGSDCDFFTTGQSNLTMTKLID